MLKNSLSLLFAFGLLVLYAGGSEYLSWQQKNRKSGPYDHLQFDHLPDTTNFASKVLAVHDFPTGNELKMNTQVPFSPGLRITFKELKPGDSSWIRATARVWFSGSSEEVLTSLVATCNQNGTNYKYMLLPLENEKLKPGIWNKVSIGYRIPAAANPEDIIQVYFWHRGGLELMVDDIRIAYFTAKSSNNQERDQ